MFKTRSNKKELMDDLQLDQPALLKNLDEIEITNRWFGSRSTLLRAIKSIYQKHEKKFTQGLTITDIGCGSGDLLRAISRWAKNKKLNMTLTGIDANPFMLKIASKKSSEFSNICFDQVNVFDDTFKNNRYDIVTLNSFCHHLTDRELVNLLQRLHQQTNLAIIINDLHRHWLPYFFIKSLARLFNFSYLAKHDGPISVLRAFSKQDLIHIMDACACYDYTITWCLAFRWQVIIWCDYYKDIHNAYHQN